MDNKITSIEFYVTFRGCGIVNRNYVGSKMIDGVWQKDVSLAKQINGKPYVSRDCILHEVLAEPMGFKLLSQSSEETDRLEVSLSKFRMLRGNLDTNADTKRKSPIMMTNAFATKECGDVYVESRAKGNMGGTFYSEDVGQTEHESKVVINLNELQFISTDGQLRARAVDSEIFGPDAPGHLKIKAIWEMNFPNTAFPSRKYYIKGKPGSADTHLRGAFQTEGVKLSDKDTAELVKFLLDGFRRFHLTKRSSELKFAKIDRVMLHTELGIEQISAEDLDRLLDSPDFKVNSFYNETDTMRDYSHIKQAIESSKEASEADRAAARKLNKERKAQRLAEAIESND